MTTGRQKDVQQGLYRFSEVGREGEKIHLARSAHGISPRGALDDGVVEDEAEVREAEMRSCTDQLLL